MNTVVSDFILSSCRLNPRPNVKRFVAWCYNAPDKRACITTGDVVELYIEPMVTCSVDVDRMVCVDKVVAVPRGRSMYRQLPSMFTEEVEVFEIGDVRLGVKLNSSTSVN